MSEDEKVLRRELVDGSAVTVSFVRKPVDDGDEGRWKPVRLEYDNPGGIRSADLRALPLTEMDRQANAKMILDDVLRLSEAWGTLPVRRPSAYDSPGRFYADLARRYGQVQATTSRPAPVIAAESGVPVTTVHRWVREARRHGWLPPARRGAAG